MKTALVFTSLLLFFLHATVSGNTSFSPGFPAVKETDTSTPPAAINLKAELLPTAGIELNWENSISGNLVSAVSKIYRSITPEGTFSLVYTFDSLVTRYIDLNIEHNTSYYYYVQNVNDTDTAAISNIVVAMSHQETTMLTEVISPLDEKATEITTPVTKALITINGLRSRVLPAPDGSRTVPLQLPESLGSYEWIDVNMNTIVGTARILDASPGKFKGVMKDLLGNVTFSEIFEVISASGDPKPGEPKNLSAYLIGHSSIQLTWAQEKLSVEGDSSDQETFNEIYRSTTSNSRYVLIHITESDTTSFTDKNLQANTTYYYRVRNVNATGASIISKEVNTTTLADNIPPSAPEKLSMVEAGTDYVLFSWKVATDNYAVAGYDVYINGVNQASTTQNIYRAENLKMNTVYTFSVKAKDLAGNISAFSNNLVVSTLKDNIPPSAPRNITSSAITMTSVDLSWEASSDNEGIARYDIYLNGSKIGSSTTNSFQAQNLPVNAVCLFSVVSVDLQENISGFSETLQVKTLADLVVPSAPSELAVSSITRNSIGLQWNASIDNVGISRYDVYINGYKSGSSTANNFIAANLQSDQTYTFSVLAVDLAGNTSPYSNQVSATVPATGLNYKYYEGIWTALPDFKKLTAVKTGVSPNIDLSVRRAGVKNNYGFLWEGYIMINTPGTYTFGTVSDAGSKVYFNTSYSHKAEALVNNDGLHAAKLATATVNIKTAGLYPIAVTFFQKVGGAAMFLYWEGPGISWQLIPNSVFSDNNSLLDYMSSNSYVKPGKNSYTGAMNNSTGATVEGGYAKTGENQALEANVLKIQKVYPNPFRQNIHIDLFNNDISNQFSAELYDAFGKLVLKEQIRQVNYGNEKIVINTGAKQITPGIYMLNIKRNGLLFQSFKVMRSSD